MSLETSSRPKKIDPTTLSRYFGWVWGLVWSRLVNAASSTLPDDYSILKTSFTPEIWAITSELHLRLIEEVVRKSKEVVEEVVEEEEEEDGRNNMNHGFMLLKVIKMLKWE